MNKNENDRISRMLAYEPDGHQLEAVWSELAAVRLDEAVSPDRTDVAWDRLSSQLGLGAAEAPKLESVAQGSDARTTATIEDSGMGWLRRVAVAAAVVLGGAVLWQQVPVTHVAPAGERVAVTLPDGSDVQLNAGSVLRHRRGFAVLPGIAVGAKSVRLEGEAFFDVESTSRPFEVEAGEARVTVLGTRFNVRARDGFAAPVRVDVEEGRVRVEALRAEGTVELEAGQAVRVVSGAASLDPEPIGLDRIAPWRSGGLTLTEEPLADVVAELGVRFGVNVSIAETVDGSVRVTAYYPLVTGVEAVLIDLATQQDLRVRKTADGWELF